MKRKWIRIALLIAGVLTLTACASTPNTSVPASSPPVSSQNTPAKTSVPVSTNVPKSVSDTLVQVWEAGQFSAAGMAVGDGSQILTVLNWEVSAPSNLEVVVPGSGRYPATVQCLDARTSATLLQIQGTHLPVISTGETNAVQQGQNAVLYDWSVSNSGFTPSEPVLRQTSVIIGSSYIDDPLWINLQMTDEMKQKSPMADIIQGAALTDETGNVIGMDAGTPNEFFFTAPPGAIRPFYIPSAIKLSSALELLSPNASSQPWANGPLEFIVVNSLATASHSGSSVPTYAEVTAAIAAVLNRMGSPMPKSDWKQYEFSSTSSTRATTLTVVYPRAVNITNQKGDVLAQAKWVGIQLGLPGRLYYGDKGGTVLGGYIINGDLSNLEKNVDSLAYHAP
jgi:hypothetical protein